MCVSDLVSKMHKKIPGKQFTFTWEHTSQKSIQIKLLQSSLYLKTAARGKVIAKNVAFVPGNPFYVNVDKVNTFRLNYTNADEEMIKEGIKRLSEAINEI